MRGFLSYFLGGGVGGKGHWAFLSLSAANFAVFPPHASSPRVVPSRGGGGVGNRLDTCGLCTFVIVCSSALFTLLAADRAVSFWRSSTSTTPPMAPPWPKVVLFGDSLTQQGYSDDGCWVAKLADAMQRRCDVVNRGLSGYTTKNFRELLSAIVTPDVVDGAVAATLFIGANDANDPDINKWQAVPLDQFEDNLRVILSHLTSHGLTKDKVIVIPTPPSDPPAWKKAWEARDGITLQGHPKTNSINRKYYDATVRIAKELGYDVLELWDDLDEPKMFSDGLHFSRAGAEVIFRHLLPLIDKRVPKEEKLPDWKKLNGVN